MTVQELIEKLQVIEDKSLPVMMGSTSDVNGDEYKYEDDILKVYIQSIEDRVDDDGKNLPSYSAVVLANGEYDEIIEDDKMKLKEFEEWKSKPSSLRNHENFKDIEYFTLEEWETVCRCMKGLSEEYDGYGYKNSCKAQINHILHSIKQKKEKVYDSLHT